jgi:site-specific recombinase XerD
MLDADSEMKRLGYSQESMCHYWEVWKRYLKFTSHDFVSREDMDSFLKQTYGIIINNKDTTRYQRGAIRAMNVLDYYSKTGKIYIRFPLSNPTPTNTALDPVLTLFQTHLQESGYADSTIHMHERVIRNFITSTVNAFRITEISMLGTEHISSFILEITAHKGKVSYELNTLRVFFRYLYVNGIHDTDLTLFLPASNKLKSREHLPSVWEDGEIISILSCIDRGNPTGKRDYAMILLALRLGLRGSDIKGLKMSDINWEQDTITIVQQKTKEPVSLPLSIEVGYAIIDYLKNGRPVSKQPYVFLALRAPYNPLPQDNHLHQILNKYIRKAGILITADRSHGMHSMRHTLASNLLKQRIPLPVISGILGHRDTNTTAEYLRIDIGQLRSCTLGLEVSYEE